MLDASKLTVRDPTFLNLSSHLDTCRFVCLNLSRAETHRAYIPTSNNLDRPSLMKARIEFPPNRLLTHLSLPFLPLPLQV